MDMRKRTKDILNEHAAFDGSLRLFNREAIGKLGQTLERRRNKFGVAGPRC